MSEHQANTIWLKAYTPGGFQVGITIGFQEGKLPLALDVEAMVIGAGYALNAPGIEPGEVTEPILYVCRYDHTDTKTGEQIPHIAFYSESEWLTKRWLHVYLDKPEDVEAFETATGLTVATMPVWMGETHPERNNPKAQKFIVRLPKSIRVARDTYTNKEGETRHKLKRYVDTIGKPQPTATGNSGQATGDTGSGLSEAGWKRGLFDASKFLYTVEGAYNEHQHKNSLKKRMEDTGELGIHVNLTLLETLNRLIRYRALHDLFLDTGDYPKIFGIPFEDYVDKHGHVATWQRMNQYYAAQLEPSKPKKAS